MELHGFLVLKNLNLNYKKKNNKLNKFVEYRKDDCEQHSPYH